MSLIQAQLNMINQDSQKLKSRRTYKNLLIFYVGAVCYISLVYGFYFWNGNLYNALVVEHNKGLKEWLVIIGSVGMFPLILLYTVMYVKMIWDGSLFKGELLFSKKE